MDLVSFYLKQSAFFRTHLGAYRFVIVLFAIRNCMTSFWRFYRILILHTSPDVEQLGPPVFYGAAPSQVGARAAPSSSWQGPRTRIHAKGTGGRFSEELIGEMDVRMVMNAFTK